jgi:hypothetical protein
MASYESFKNKPQEKKPNSIFPVVKVDLMEFNPAPDI